MKKILVIVIPLFLFGCSEEFAVDTYTGPPLPVVVFKAPSTSSTHAEAENVIGWVEEFNGFSTSLNDFSSTEPTVSGDTYTWSFTENGVTYTLTGVIRPDSGYDWKLVLNGTQTGGPTYNNWTAFEGTTDAARRNANWTIYGENTTEMNSEFQWTISSNESLIGTLTVYADGVLSGKTVITNFASGVGEIRIYEVDALRYKAVWLSNGSGQYEYYDDQGIVTSQGNWS